MIFLPKCRALCVNLEKGHGAWKKGHDAGEKRAWRGAIVKVARGNSGTLRDPTHVIATYRRF